MTTVTSDQPVSEVISLSYNHDNLTSNYHNITFLRVPIAEAESDFETPEDEEEEEHDEEDEVDEEDENNENHSQVKSNVLSSAFFVFLFFIVFSIPCRKWVQRCIYCFMTITRCQ